MQGESSHTCTTEPFAARVGPRAMRMLIRAHENAARGHIAFSHFGDAAAILSARGLVHKRWHASISQGSCICTSYTPQPNRVASQVHVLVHRKFTKFTKFTESSQKFT